MRIGAAGTQACSAPPAGPILDARQTARPGPPARLELRGMRLRSEPLHRELRGQVPRPGPDRGRLRGGRDETELRGLQGELVRHGDLGDVEPRTAERQREADGGDPGDPSTSGIERTGPGLRKWSRTGSSSAGLLEWTLDNCARLRNVRCTGLRPAYRIRWGRGSAVRPSPCARGKKTPPAGGAVNCWAGAMLRKFSPGSTDRSAGAVASSGTSRWNRPPPSTSEPRRRGTRAAQRRSRTK